MISTKRAEYFVHLTQRSVQRLRFPILTVESLLFGITINETGHIAPKRNNIKKMSMSQDVVLFCF